LIASNLTYPFTINLPSYIKDNNILSYQKMMFINAPPPHPKYKGKNLLKMYMIWNKNETKEISENYGRKYENILPCRNEGADDGEINFPNK
jgi:hypothetical protein